MKKVDRGHARFSPSGSSRWLHCPGSIPFIESLKLKPWSSAPAELGTATHTLLEMALNARCSPHKFLGKKIKGDFTIRPGGYVVDRGMADSAEAAVDHVAPVLEKAIASGVESELDIPATGQWGFVDAWALSEFDTDWALDGSTELVLDVWDFKNGRHPVSAKENSQMRLYGNGALFACRDHIKGRRVAMRLHILQPNAYVALDNDIDTWKTNSVKESSWIATYVVPAVQAIKNGTAKRIPGNHCKNCDGAARCPELAKAAAQAARMTWAKDIK